MTGLSGINAWLFDMDDTLYDATAHIFPEMGRLMRVFMSERLGVPFDLAWAERDRLWHKYGATLRGLMEEYGIEPGDFLEKTHSMDIGHVPKDPALAERIARLPGKKYLFTNSSTPFATRMTAHLGLDTILDGIFAIEDADYWPKPAAATYDAFLAKFTVDPKTAIFFEDSEQNLKPARALGMTTVWITRHAEEGAELPHVQHRTHSLRDWLDAHTSKLTAA
jgi:putative hydrolase of the HAD superfamily